MLKSSLAAIHLPAFLKQPAWWGAGFSLLAKTLGHGHVQCMAWAKKLAAEACYFFPGSRTKLGGDRNEIRKVNTLAPKSFWQTWDYLWMCQEKLLGQTPEPSISEVTSVFWETQLCSVQFEKEGSDSSPCDKWGPFVKMERVNSVSLHMREMSESFSKYFSQIRHLSKKILISAWTSGPR